MRWIRTWLFDQPNGRSISTASKSVLCFRIDRSKQQCRAAAQSRVQPARCRGSLKCLGGSSSERIALRHARVATIAAQLSDKAVNQLRELPLDATLTPASLRATEQWLDWINASLLETFSDLPPAIRSVGPSSVWGWVLRALAILRRQRQKESATAPTSDQAPP